MIIGELLKIGRTKRREDGDSGRRGRETKRDDERRGIGKNQKSELTN